MQTTIEKNFFKENKNENKKKISKLKKTVVITSGISQLAKM